MKQFPALSIFLSGLLLVAATTTGCFLNGESSQPDSEATATAVIVVPTAEEPSATDESVTATTANTDDSVAKTDIISVVITAAEATLHGGPGEDYPVVATAFGGITYPVSGVSQDDLWWRLTCYDDAAILIDACWVSADPAVAMPTTSTAMSSKPYIELTFDFLRAVQAGLTAAGSEQYLSRDLQSVVEAGRPLPSLFGIRDAFPSFVMTDFSDPRAEETAQVRVRFNYDNPNYAIISLIQEDGDWQIDKVATHNLVKTFSTGELMQAESVIVAYYEALANGETDTAFDLLSNELQEDTSHQVLSTIADDLEKLTVTTMQPIRSTADQIVYYVRLLAVTDREQSAVQLGDWRDGENSRWLTMIRDNDDWRIAQIIKSPILSEVASWQRVNVLPINMTLDVPADWTRPGLLWAWSPNSTGMPSVGVSWADLSEYGGDETVLPRYRRELSIRPLDLGWAQGTQYTFELMGGPGEAPISAESHMIVQTGRRAYNFYTTATDVAELDNMRPILQRMVAAVNFNDPQASAFNSVETSVNFLATLLRDGTGASSLSYLSEDLKARASDQSSLLSLLGVDTLFQSFNASWLENPADGQAHVGVTLNFADSTTELIFTVQRAANDSWLITEIKPAN